MNAGVERTLLAPPVVTATPLIRLRGVTKRYGSGAAELLALKGIDLDIAAGEFVAIMGPSGSGKSTAIPSLWIALSPIGKASCVETIAGTHNDKTMQWPRSFNSRGVSWDKNERPDFIDYEKLRGDPSVRFLAWDMEPGDAILIHPRVHHGGGDNPDATRDRIALSTRWIGDDIRWAPRPEAVNTPGLPHSEMVAGAAPGDRAGDDAIFPVTWKRESLASQAAE